jgi:hypothetical protein
VGKHYIRKLYTLEILTFFLQALWWDFISQTSYMEKIWYLENTVIQNNYPDGLVKELQKTL